ncbi:glucose dehydrogenase [FAD, quinone]-like isoform X2 [Tribolium madens]|uniref:glucose dehydrogenase [FAD, quinone]-like isoform X2 n=1 Tax=Tribolium madens TaxID=41895 RepID=UPI001CF76036|nr:glucose dehydrogenase [FAD, quinone]-like isoform X2 [Tribolium madens]
MIRHKEVLRSRFLCTPLVKMWATLSVLLVILPKIINSDPAVDFYKKVINENVAKVENYKLPKNNAEFINGSQATEIKDFGGYDFIIIGAGSAEAGGDENDFSTIPSMWVNLQMSNINWGYLTTPQKNCCLGMKNRQCLEPRGKAIGGSSTINAIAYVRGNPEDYNKWDRLGNPGWSYKEVLPYFLKSENSQVDGDPGFHGKGGLWNIQYSLPPSELFSNFLQANKELGLEALDYNGYRQIGASKSQTNIKRGKRQSTGTAFLSYARERRNLNVITKTLVTEIIIDKKYKTAEGVVFIKDDQKFRANANLEVIVSAGAINSPQLLMLSGIGPKEHLEGIGIDLIADLPVGKNLLEHPMFPGLAFRTNYTVFAESLNEQIKSFLKGKGPLSTAVEAVAFMAGPDNIPSIEYIFMPQTGTPSAFDMFNFNQELENTYLAKINSTTDFNIFVVLLHQKSKGEIRLKSKDPIDFPEIDLNLFEKQEDVDTLIEGINFVIKLTKAQAFQDINATLIDIPICQEYEKYSKSFWNCAIRHMSMTMYHPCGTTAMGPNSTTAVVDNQLRVYGIEKLRVVDAGVMPSTVSGHLNAPTIMIAEKISDVIKATYN